MNTRNQHVVPHGQGWAIKSEGSNRLMVFHTKSEAIDAAQKIAAANGAELLVHGKKGQIFYRSELPVSLDEGKIREAVRKNSVARSSKMSSIRKK